MYRATHLREAETARKQLERTVDILLENGSDEACDLAKPWQLVLRQMDEQIFELEAEHRAMARARECGCGVHLSVQREWQEKADSLWLDMVEGTF